MIRLDQLDEAKRLSLMLGLFRYHARRLETAISDRREIMVRGIGDDLKLTVFERHEKHRAETPIYMGGPSDR